MKKLADFLDIAKEVTGSDYKTAQRLNLTRSAISFARKNGSMDSDNAVELAKIINVNPGNIIAACNIAKHPENVEIWGKWVATFCLTTSGLLFSIQSVTAKAASVVCILC